jgi:hypothetical protein
VVQRRLAEALDETAPGPIRIVSMCAGQGRDVIGVLADHRRKQDVTARLVELDADLVRVARAMAQEGNLGGLDIVQGDASLTSAYVGAVPANVISVCGVFGNVSEADIRQTILELPSLSAPAATVIWTRHRLAPDLTPTIRGWFNQGGFEEVAFDTEGSGSFGVGTHRLVGAPRPFRANHQMFTFTGDGVAALAPDVPLETERLGDPIIDRPLEPR